MIVKKIDGENRNLEVIPENGFYDITSVEFNRNNQNKERTNFIINSLNNTIKTLIIDRPEPDDILLYLNNQINYLIPDLHIYSNRHCNDIVLNNNTGTKITKILITYGDKMLYFDMKIRSNYVILSQNDYKINVLSEMLNKKDKQKVKK